ncbi:MAG TPA: FHA domain-containing protein [Kofleriaceae bacterium]|nr:FHA domain-containing protein [Kofleriaceae bacterium]
MRRTSGRQAGYWLIVTSLVIGALIAVAIYAWASTLARLPRLLLQGPAVVVLVLVVIALVLVTIVALQRPAEPPWGRDLPGLPSTMTVRRGGRVIVEHATDQREIVLGSAPSCDLQLAGAGIHKRHAIVRKRTADRVELEPIGRAVVRINGERIAGRHTIGPRDVLQLGDLEITLVIRTPPKPPQQPDDTSLN